MRMCETMRDDLHGIYDDEYFDIEEEEYNLSDCPYFEGYGSCSYSCLDEPACQTEIPAGGWPKLERPAYKEFLIAARRYQYRVDNWIGWQIVKRFMQA